MNREESGAAIEPAFPSRGMFRLVLVLLYFGCAMASSLWSIHRYREFASGWAWDLAHVNQSFWALTQGLDRITVRPLNHYAREGPEPWRSVHLDPIRLVLLPVYWLWPRPETLLVGHCFVFWLSVFGVARLARGSGKPAGPQRLMPAIVAAIAWALTPASFLMAINDCRSLQLGVPFLLWAVAGYVERRVWLFAVSALAALCSRQEYAVAIAALAVLPFQHESLVSGKWVWRAVTLVIGLGWFAGYLWYLDQFFGPRSVLRYFTVPSQFARTGIGDDLAGFVETLGALALLTGGWFLLMLLSPRYLLASLPLVYMIVQRNPTRLLPGDQEWHMIRYAAIPVAFWVAGGAVVWRRLSLDRVAWWNTQRAARKWMFAMAATITCVAPSIWIQQRLAAIPALVPPEDRQRLRSIIDQISNEAGVWTDYPYAAMLSSRSHIYWYLDPPVSQGPNAPIERWIFSPLPTLGSDREIFDQMLQSRGFEVFRGRQVIVLRHIDRVTGG
jgi:Predicted membrane protein (DUF2079)